MEYLYYGLISLVVSAVVSYLMIQIFLYNKKRRDLKKEIKLDDIKTYEDMLYQINKLYKKDHEIESKIRFINNRCDKLKENATYAIKNIGLVRYKYSDDAGGNLSFSLALMDDNQNGLVFTNISLIDSNSLYVRRIREGISDVLLMEEEKEAIKQAIEKVEQN